MLTYTATHKTLITGSGFSPKILRKKSRGSETGEELRWKKKGRADEHNTKSGRDLEKIRFKLYVVQSIRTFYFTL